LYGVGNKYTRSHCENLGFFYANQGLYKKALVHFQQMIEKLALSQKYDLDFCSFRNEYIEEICGWILKVVQIKEGARTLEIQAIFKGVFQDLTGTPSLSEPRNFLNL